ncbi:MAG: hypothetical protein H0V00_05260 [Chloroflexia bacterium]|nr:hypothetical protein [Chloroflexia bacterium]
MALGTRHSALGYQLWGRPETGQQAICTAEKFAKFAKFAKFDELRQWTIALTDGRRRQSAGTNSQQPIADSGGIDKYEL